MEPNRNSVHRYGLFLLLWGNFETLIDYLITTQLKITHLQGHIVCGGLQFGAKAAMLKSLLNIKSEPDKEGVRLISDVISSAERNFLIHGIPTFDKPSGDMFFSKRSVANNINVKVKSFTEDEMKEHLDKFIAAISRVEDHFGHSAEDFTDFIITARMLSYKSKT